MRYHFVYFEPQLGAVIFECDTDDEPPEVGEIIQLFVAGKTEPEPYLVEEFYITPINQQATHILIDVRARRQP